MEFEVDISGGFKHDIIMSRCQQKYSEFRRQVGGRIIQIVEEHLKISLSAAARTLGYKNATTLYAVKKGRVLPDPEKLVLATTKWRDSRGRRLDLHWLLTGEGEAFPKSGSYKCVRDNDIINSFEKLSEAKRKALLTLIDVV